MLTAEKLQHTSEIEHVFPRHSRVLKLDRTAQTLHSLCMNPKNIPSSPNTSPTETESGQATLNTASV